MTTFYPLTFQPILKDKIWGGQKLAQHFNKPSNGDTVGESWEVSTVPNSVSVVENGNFKGQNLQELIQQHPEELLGKKNYKRFGKQFPLLVKFIDAKADLSIQLHPDDTLAKQRHNSFGKTEMWYVMQADANAKLIVGFNQPMDKATYLKHLKNNTLTEILNFDTVKPGDTYFIEAGRVHAIGAGVLLAEIQQTSDITYRVYDWDRVDTDGKGRELHNDIAIDAFKFNMADDFRVNYPKVKNASNAMVHCPFFTTNYVDLNQTLNKTNTWDSFVIYMCVEGQCTLTTENTSQLLKTGETVLLPAAITNYSLQSTNAKLLEVYI